MCSYRGLAARLRGEAKARKQRGAHDEPHEELFERGEVESWIAGGAKRESTGTARSRGRGVVIHKSLSPPESHFWKSGGKRASYPVSSGAEAPGQRKVTVHLAICGQPPGQSRFFVLLLFFLFLLFHSSFPFSFVLLVRRSIALISLGASGVSAVFALVSESRATDKQSQRIHVETVVGKPRNELIKKVEKRPRCE